MPQLDPHPGQNIWRFRSIARQGLTKYIVHTMHFKTKVTPSLMIGDELQVLWGNYSLIGGPSWARRPQMLCVHGPDRGLFFQKGEMGSGDGRTYEMYMPWVLTQSVFCTAGEGGVELKTTYWPGPVGLLLGANKTTFYQTPPANMYIQSALERYFVTGMHYAQPTIAVYTPGRWSPKTETFEPHQTVQPSGYWSTQKRRRDVPWGANTPWKDGAIDYDDGV